jgi:hypothetical protein
MTRGSRGEVTGYVRELATCAAAIENDIAQHASTTVADG